MHNELKRLLIQLTFYLIPHGPFIFLHCSFHELSIQVLLLLSYEVVLLSHVPIPFVNLTLLQSELLSHLLNGRLVPIRVLVISDLELNKLVLIFSESFSLFFFFASRVIPNDLFKTVLDQHLLLSKKSTHTLVQVIRSHVIIENDPIYFNFSTSLLLFQWNKNYFIIL